MVTRAEAEKDFYGKRPDIAAASLRGAIRGEIYPIDVTTSSKTFIVPTDWKGCLVRVQADGGDIYYQISTDAGAPAACAAAGGTFALPRAGDQNARLLAAAGAGGAWVNYSIT